MSPQVCFLRGGGRVRLTLRIYLIWRTLYGVVLVSGSLVVLQQREIDLVKLLVLPDYYWFVLAGALYVFVYAALGKSLFMLLSILGISAALTFELDWQLASVLIHSTFFAIGVQLRGGPILKRRKVRLMIVILAIASACAHALLVGYLVQTAVYLLGGLLASLSIGSVLFTSSSVPNKLKLGAALQLGKARQLMTRIGENTLQIFLLSPFFITLGSSVLAPRISQGSVSSSADVVALAYALILTSASLWFSIVLGRLLERRLPGIFGKSR